MTRQQGFMVVGLLWFILGEMKAGDALLAIVCAIGGTACFLAALLESR